MEGNTTYYNSGAPKQAEASSSKMSEDEKIELLTKYKKLLDDGVITQEEFDNKKKEIL